MINDRYNVFVKTKKYKNRTKAYINMALFALMQKKDYDDISVKEICEKAGVSRMSFYRYYMMKDDIFINYCDERFEEFYDGIGEIENLDLNTFSLEIFKFVYKYMKQIKILFMAHREFMLLEQLNSYARYVFANLKSDFLPTEKNNPVYAFFMAGGLFNVIVYWVNSPTPVSPEKLNDMLYSIAKQ